MPQIARSMATISTRNGIHYADFYDAARTPARKRHSLKTADRRLAKRLLARLEEAYLLGDYDPWTTTPDVFCDRRPRLDRLDTVVRRYIEVKAFEVRPVTVSNYRYTLGQFERHAGAQTPIQRIEQEVCRAFVLAEGLKRATQRQRYARLRAFFSWCEREDYVKASPFKRLRPPSAEERVPRALTEAELNAMLEALRSDYERKRAEGKVPEGELIWWGDVWRFAMLTGLRRGELARLRWGHIDEERRLIFIHQQKNGLAQTVPLGRAAQAVLAGMTRGEDEHYVFIGPANRQLTERKAHCWGNRASFLFARYRGLAGIERHVTLHGARHRFCSALAEAGKSAWVIQAAARHGTVTTSQRYVSLANEMLKKELDEVFDSL